MLMSEVDGAKTRGTTMPSRMKRKLSQTLVGEEFYIMIITIRIFSGELSCQFAMSGKPQKCPQVIQTHMQYLTQNT